MPFELTDPEPTPCVVRLELYLSELIGEIVKTAEARAAGLG